MLRRPSLFACLRMVLLAMLMLGACVQPALAAACDVEDARIALDAGNAIHADTGEAGDCCTNPACGDCCLHAVASLPAVTHASPLIPGAGIVATPVARVRPADYPVDSRPPIRN